MRKLILNLALSLDGFIEGPYGEYDWCFTDQDYGMSDFLNNIDAIFFGRKSYQVLVQTENNPYPAQKKYVFTNTLPKVPGNFYIIRGEIEKEVETIKNETGRDIWLFGGARLTSSLINAGLVDELQLSLHPILLGKGKPLFKDIIERLRWKLKDTKAYSTGLVQLYYQNEKHNPAK